MIVPGLQLDRDLRAALAIELSDEERRAIEVGIAGGADTTSDAPLDTESKLSVIAFANAGIEISPSWLAHWRRGHAS